MDDRLVTIARFSTPVNAHIARARLEADGIDAIVLNENIANINPIYGALDGLAPVELQVRATDVQLAITSLGMTESPEKTVPPAPEACPRCGSPRVIRSRNPLAFILCLLLIIYDPALSQRRWRCQKCHHAWKTR